MGISTFTTDALYTGMHELGLRQKEVPSLLFYGAPMASYVSENIL